jgi:hypothetical protein
MQCVRLTDIQSVVKHKELELKQKIIVGRMKEHYHFLPPKLLFLRPL